MTDDGPVMANLRLDGILPHDVTTRDDYEKTHALIAATRIPYTLLTDSEEVVQAATLYLRFNNPSQNKLHVKTQFMHGHQVRIEPQTLDMTLDGKEEKIVRVEIRSSEPMPTDNPALLRLDWTMGYKFEKEEDLFLSGTRNIPLKPSSFSLIKTVSPEYVGSLSVAMANTEPGYAVDRKSVV